VQGPHRCPQLLEQVVADLALGDLVQRAAVNLVHDQQHRSVGRPDDPVDRRHVDACPLRHDREQGLMLDGLLERGRWPGVADVLEPDRPVGPVQQVGVPLVGAVGLDEQPAPVVGDRGERPRAPRLDVGLPDRGDRQAGRAELGRDRAGSRAPVGHARRHAHAQARQCSRGSGDRQFHRQGRAGEQPRHARPQHEAQGRAAPSPAQPRHHRDADGNRGGRQGRVGERGSGQPRPTSQVRCQRGRVAVPGQRQDRGRRGRRRAAGYRQAGQQPEPAVQPGGDQDGRRAGAHRHLDQADQRLGGLAAPEQGQHRRPAAEQAPAGDRDRDQQHGEQSGAADQDDDIAGVPDAGLRQPQRDRITGDDRLSHGRSAGRAAGRDESARRVRRRRQRRWA